LFKGSLYLIISRILFVMSSYVIHIFAARHFGVVEYGFLGILLNLVAMIRVFLSFGLPQSISIHISKNKQRKEEILKSGTVLMVLYSLAISILYFFGSGLIAEFLKEKSLVNFIQLTTLMIPTMAIFQLHHNALNGQKLFGKQAISLSCYSIGRIFFSFLFILIGFRIGGIILGFTISSIVAFSISKKFNPSIKKATFFPFKKIIKLSFPILLSSIGLVIILNIDILYVKNIMLDPEFTGYYVTAAVLAKVPYILFFAFSMTFLPTIAHNLKKKDEPVKIVIENGMRQFLILILPVVILLSGFSKQVIHIVYSNKYIFAAEPLSILSFGFGFLAIFASIISIFNAVKPKIPIIISFIGIILQFILCYSIIPKLGIIGAAVSTTMTSFFLMLIGILAIKKFFGGFIRLNSFIKIFSVSVLLFLTVNVLASLKISEYLVFITAPLVLVLYFGFLYLIGEVTKKEIKNIVGKIKNLHFKKISDIGL